MTRDQAVARIQQGLGFRSDLSTEIVSALKEAQRSLEAGRTLPSFLLQEDQSLAVTSGSGEINLPAGFIKESGQREGRLRYTDSSTNDPVFLEKMGMDEALKKYTLDSVDPGKPKAYVIRSATIAIYPERDTSYTLTWSYYKRADVLDTNIENAWLEEAPSAGGLMGAPEALIGKAGMSIARDLRNKEALEIFTQMYAESWAGRIAYDYEREDENDHIRVGGRL